MTKIEIDSRRTALAVTFTITALVLGSTYYFAVSPRLRIFYAARDVAKGNARTDLIWSEYGEKRRAGVGWTKNAVETALWFAQGSNSFESAGKIDRFRPTRVDVYHGGGGGAWDVEWAGSRWRCHADRSGFGFRTRFARCS